MREGNRYKCGVLFCLFGFFRRSGKQSRTTLRSYSPSSPRTQPPSLPPPFTHHSAHPHIAASSQHPLLLHLLRLQLPHFGLLLVTLLAVMIAIAETGEGEGGERVMAEGEGRST